MEYGGQWNVDAFQILTSKNTHSGATYSITISF